MMRIRLCARWIVLGDQEAVLGEGVRKAMALIDYAVFVNQSRGLGFLKFRIQGLFRSPLVC